MTTPKRSVVAPSALICAVALCAVPTLAAQELSLSERTVAVEGRQVAFRIGGHGPPLLLVHGFTFTGEQWDPFLGKLSAEHTVIVPDLPGHGASTDVPGEFRYRDAAAHLFSFLDTLSIERVFAIGQSAGASILIHMAIQEPSRIGAMVLVAGAHRLSPSGRVILRGLQLQDMPEALVDYYRRHHPGGETQAESLFVRLRALANNYDDFALLPEDLATIEAKTLLVWGDRDVAYPVDFALELYRAIPDAALWVVPEQGHYPVWEWLGGSKEAQRIFASRVLRFLADGKMP